MTANTDNKPICTHRLKRLSYVKWHEWAAKINKQGKEQQQCKTCGLWLFECEI